jgi:hypothetical protein
MEIMPTIDLVDCALSRGNLASDGGSRDNRKVGIRAGRPRWYADSLSCICSAHLDAWRSITLLPARKEQAVSVTADLDHERDHVRSGAQDEADLGDFTRSIIELDRAGAIKAFRLETSL